MKSSRLYIFVEGPSDEKLLKYLLIKKLDIRLKPCPMQYSKKSIKERTRWINAIIQREERFIIFADQDPLPCYGARKDEVQKSFGGKVENKKIMVVCKEIESWYLAGLSEAASIACGVSWIPCTDNRGKSCFVSSQFDSEHVLQTEILKFFDLKMAKQKNHSFKYFIDKMLPRSCI